MAERSRTITLKGTAFTLVGNEVKVGDKAPDFEVLGNDLSAVRLSDYAGRVVIISSVPSLDTPVCDVQTRKFNEEAAGLSEDVVILTVSVDLPFAQKRWCGAAGVENVVTVSDHRETLFGKAFGMLIKELRILGRAVFVIDREGTVRYVQIVDELADEPDYEAALEAARSLLTGVK